MCIRWTRLCLTCDVKHDDILAGCPLSDGCRCSSWRSGLSATTATATAITPATSEQTTAAAFAAAGTSEDFSARMQATQLPPVPLLRYMLARRP